MGMLDSFLHPEAGYEAAEEEARRAWEEAKGFEKPFYEHGLEQYGPLNEARSSLMNPMELENKWSSGYETSPYARRMLDMNKASGLDAASAMGLMGSSAAIGNIQQGAGDIVARDRQDFLNRLMQKYMTGIGLGENLYGTGAQMGSQLGQQAMQHGSTMGGLEYGRASAPGQMLGNWLNTGLKVGMNMIAPGSSLLIGNSNMFNQGVPPYMEKAIYGGAS